MKDEFDVSQEAKIALLGGNKRMRLKTFGFEVGYRGKPQDYDFDNDVNEFLENVIPENIQTITVKEDKVTILIWYTEKD